MKVSYIITEEVATVVMMDTGKSYTINNTHPNWATVIEKLSNEDYDDLEELLSVKEAITKYVGDNGVVTVDDVGVKYKDKYVDNYLTKTILSFMEKKLPFKPLIKFFEKVMKNPSRRATEELYKFLEHGNMPITPDGNFIGYKAIKGDWTDCHTGKCDNSIGNTLEKERNEVCDDPNLGCSYGYHVGTIGYATGFRPYDGRIVLVEVDPSDVVSVPHDCASQKLRTAKYKVLQEFERVLNSDYDEVFSSQNEYDEDDDEDNNRDDYDDDTWDDEDEDD